MSEETSRKSGVLKLSRKVAKTNTHADEQKAVRIAPQRSQGESEVRLRVGGIDYEGSWLGLQEKLNDPLKNIIVDGIEGGTLKLSQIEQSTTPRGYMSDVDSTIFSSVVDAAGNEVASGPSMANTQGQLSDSEYFNRKIQAEQLNIRQNYLDKLAGLRLPRFLVPDSTEFPYNPEAQYIGLMLPYRRCLFILNPGVDARLVYCEQLDEDKIKLTVKISTHGEDNADTIGEFQFEWKEGKLIEEGWFSDEFTKATAQELRCILAILDGMSKNYVVAEGDPPPKDRVIPEARNGCTVRVVKLHPQAETIRKAWQGGTHASPREHTRRGHWRRGRNGKRIWVDQLIVNKGKTDGVVDKEYYIRKKETIARKLAAEDKHEH